MSEQPPGSLRDGLLAEAAAAERAFIDADRARRAAFRAAHTGGASFRDIAAATGLSASSVHYLHGTPGPGTEGRPPRRRGVRQAALPVPGLPPANEPLPGLPRGWTVLWCPRCGYSITVTEAEREDWRDSQGWACAHDCQAEAPRC